MCSEGSVSARDSFVYISEAVLSNHGDAPDDTCPENMQCLTVSTTEVHFLLSVSVSVHLMFVVYVGVPAYARPHLQTHAFLKGPSGVS